MSIDLLPFSAFALESSGAAAQVARESYTLTLPLQLSTFRAFAQPVMTGIITLADASDEAAAEGVWHAAVVPACGTGVTITF